MSPTSHPLNCEQSHVLDIPKFNLFKSTFTYIIYLFNGKWKISHIGSVYTDTYQWHIGGTSLDKASKDFSDLYS